MQRGFATSRRHWEAQRSANSVGSVSEPEEHALEEPGWGLARPRAVRAPYKAKEGNQWEPRQGGVISFSGTGFPLGRRAEVSGLQSLRRACLTRLGSRGRPTGQASPAKANTGNA